jgi:hypothetical protein
MKINNIRFTDTDIIGVDESGKEWKQSLLWYPGLKNATTEQRNNYEVGFDGFHWRNVDEDVSFESFFYEDAEPTPLQRFFLTHKEIKISEFAKMVGIDATLLRNYINGFKKPSQAREQVILDGIHTLAREYAAAAF